MNGIGRAPASLKIITAMYSSPGMFVTRADSGWPGFTAVAGSPAGARFIVPDDAAYRLARALHKGEAAIAKRLPQAIETTSANTVAAAPRVDLIHPGAQRYLREAGFLR